MTYEEMTPEQLAASKLALRNYNVAETFSAIRFALELLCCNLLAMGGGRLLMGEIQPGTWTGYVICASILNFVLMNRRQRVRNNKNKEALTEEFKRIKALNT